MKAATNSPMNNKIKLLFQIWIMSVVRVLKFRLQNMNNESMQEYQ